jgi:hypothetical protein
MSFASNIEGGNKKCAKNCSKKDKPIKQQEQLIKSLNYYKRICSKHSQEPRKGNIHI